MQDYGVDKEQIEKIKKIPVIEPKIGLDIVSNTLERAMVHRKHSAAEGNGNWNQKRAEELNYGNILVGGNKNIPYYWTGTAMKLAQEKGFEDDAVKEDSMKVPLSKSSQFCNGLLKFN